MIIGAYNFKDWYIAVWVWNRNAKFPKECACCACQADLQLEALPFLDGRNSISYPICTECRQHANLDDRIVGISMLIGFLVPVVLYYAVFGLHFLKRGFFLTFILIFIAGVLVSGAIYFPFSGRKKSSDCQGSGWPISEDSDVGLDQILGKATERKDEREAKLRIMAFKEIGGKEAFGLKFQSTEFAAKFIELNGGDPQNIEFIDEAM